MTQSFNVPSNFTGVLKLKNGNKFWFKNGKWHRLDGPALVWTDGDKTWYQNGKIHRLDGPAVVLINGIREYWISGKKYSKEEFDEKIKLIQQQLSKRNTDYKHLSDEQWHDYLNILVLE